MSTLTEFLMKLLYLKEISHNGMHNIIQTTASMDVQTVVAMCVVGS